MNVIHTPSKGLLFFTVLNLRITVTYPKPPGNLLPVHPHLCSTQNVTFTCILDDSPSDPSVEIKFQQDGIELTENIIVFNSTVAQYTIYNVSLAEEVDISCCSGSCKSDLSNVIPATICVHGVVCDGAVKLYGVGFNPHPYDCTQFVQCFYFPRDRVEPVYRNCEYGQFWDHAKMRCLPAHRVNCKHVRPAPVHALSAETINSTCILVQWQTDHIEHNKIHRIRVSSTSLDFQEIRFNALETNSGNFVKRIVCDLNPSTDYRFDVQILPVEGGYWSVANTATAKTKDSITAYHPKFKDGVYEWVPKTCTKPGGHRKICIHWKVCGPCAVLPLVSRRLYWPLHPLATDCYEHMQSLTMALEQCRISCGDTIYPMKQKLPEMYHNGKIQGYRLELWPASGDIIQVDIPEDHMSTCVRRVPCDVAYTVVIIDRGSSGKYSNKASIKVTNAVPGKGITQTNFIPEIGNFSAGMQSVEITWPEITASVKRRLGVRSFTVCWCVNEQGNCKKHVHINCDVEDNGDKAVVHVDNPEAYIYGVSMETKYGNTGLHWQSCIYMKYTEPTKEPERVSAETGGQTNTILVMWNTIKCESGQPYIASYMLLYCPVNSQTQECSNGDKKFVTVPATVCAHVIVDLAKDQMYRIQVRGVTKDDKTSHWSVPVYATTSNNDLPPGAIVGCSIGGVFVLALAVAGGICGFRDFRKRTRKYIASQGAIKMPKISSEPAEDTLENEGYENLTVPVPNVQTFPDIQVKDNTLSSGYITMQVLLHNSSGANNQSDGETSANGDSEGLSESKLRDAIDFCQCSNSVQTASTREYNSDAIHSMDTTGYVSEEYLKCMASDNYQMQDVVTKGHGENIGESQMERRSSLSRTSSCGDEGIDNLENQSPDSDLPGPATPQSVVVNSCDYISHEVLKKFETSKM